eukprot:18973-Heterococcus_DN1.PRE.1
MVRTRSTDSVSTNHQNAHSFYIKRAHFTITSVLKGADDVLHRCCYVSIAGRVLSCSSTYSEFASFATRYFSLQLHPLQVKSPILAHWLRGSKLQRIPCQSSGKELLVSTAKYSFRVATSQAVAGSLRIRTWRQAMVHVAATSHSAKQQSS